MANDKKTGTKLISSNKKANFNYLLFDKFEAGIALLGTEIKSIRKNGANLTDSYIKVTDIFIKCLEVTATCKFILKLK